MPASGSSPGTVPTLDFRRFETDRASFVEAFGNAYRAFGFCCLSHHGIPSALVREAGDVFRHFFALPDADKRRHFAGPGGARGFTPFKIETARGASLPDLKEFWHIGREIPRDSRYAEWMPPNRWPEGIAGFRQLGYALFTALDALGGKVMSALALHIGLTADWFDDKIDCGNSILRAIHYPPIQAGDLRHARAGAHEDINLITLLAGASAAGLEIMTRHGDWLPVETSDDTIVINIGDMLQRLSNHVYPSTTHRVRNPAGAAAHTSRYSIPYFLHPNPDFMIETLPCCVTADNPRRYPEPIIANDYLQQRLHEIRLT